MTSEVARLRSLLVQVGELVEEIGKVVEAVEDPRETLPRWQAECLARMESAAAGGGCARLTGGELTRAQQMQMGSLLRSRGWVKARATVDGHRYTVWIPPEVYVECESVPDDDFAAEE